MNVFFSSVLSRLGLRQSKVEAAAGVVAVAWWNGRR